LTTLFNRSVKLVIASPLEESLSSVSGQTIEIVDLRVLFKITKDLSKDPNKAEIKVYNLSAKTRASLFGKSAKVLLHAGYEDAIEQIFVGDVRFIESKQEGVDWVTSFQCGDGERAVKFSRIGTSFGAGTPIGTVINTIASAAKIDVGNLASVADQIPGQYTQGYAGYGKAIKELDKILKSAGYELSIQDGALQALKPDETTTEEILELTPDSGLIGSPEMGSAGKKGSKPVLKAKALLQPVLKPGKRVSLKSRQYSGIFKVIKVEHDGDTAGGNWFSDLELQTL